MSLLGLSVTDRITGFTGVVTGRASYVSGCSQLLVAPTCDGNTYRESQWFDEQRCVVIADVERIVLDNGATPGCDRAAPRR